MNSPPMSIWIGYDDAQAIAFAVARYSIRRFNRTVPIYGLVLSELRDRGLYYRETTSRDGQLWDAISEAPMSTEFAISRFLVPTLTSGWALFCDIDVIFRRNVSELFSLARPDKAVMVVKHDYAQSEGIKMGGKAQTVYPRKNWSSVMLFNCDHPANDKLTIEYVNSVPGRDLHRFAWLEDHDIGELPAEWNYLVGHSKLNGSQPAVVHFTEGLPNIPGYEKQEYAEEWHAMRPHAVGAAW